MKARVTKKGITVTGILNESLLEDACLVADKAGCQKKSEDYHTKLVVTGTQVQLNKFVQLWNKGC